MKILKNIGIVACMILAGCGNVAQKDIIVHPEVVQQPAKEIEYSKIIYLRNVVIAKNYRSKFVPIYSQGKIKFSDKYVWGAQTKDILFSELAKFGYKKNIKFSQANNRNFVDCYIEQVFYNIERKEMVAMCTIIYNGQAKAMFISLPVQGPSEASNILGVIALRIVDFVA